MVKKIRVMESILEFNDARAAENRALLESHGVFTVNLMSSPGSGKTTLLERTLERIPRGLRAGVIEGDIQTTRDAERLERFHVPIIQINTGSACHLDGEMIARALAEMPLDEIDLLFIENVGNLVCPAEFRVGEHHKVIILSVTEGDDKPLKYPLMFRESTALVLNKIDLLPYTDFSLDAARANAMRIHQELEILEVSCRSGQGLEGWLEWLEGHRALAFPTA